MKTPHYMNIIIKPQVLFNCSLIFLFILLFQARKIIIMQKRKSTSNLINPTIMRGKTSGLKPI
jgi:hypothetical protein